MSNIDLDSERVKELWKGQDAICCFYAVLSLEQMIMIVENENAAGGNKQKEMKHLLASIPMRALARCPEDFRHAIRQWKDACEEKLEESGSVPKEIQLDMRDKMDLLMVKYQVEGRMPQVMCWVMKEAEVPSLKEYGVLSLKGNDAAARNEILKRLKGIKEKLDSGEVVIPEKQKEE